MSRYLLLTRLMKAKRNLRLGFSTNNDDQSDNKRRGKMKRGVYLSQQHFIYEYSYKYCFV